jgi:hypothetical protein
MQLVSSAWRFSHYRFVIDFFDINFDSVEIREDLLYDFIYFQICQDFFHGSEFGLS